MPLNHIGRAVAAACLPLPLAVIAVIASQGAQAQPTPQVHRTPYRLEIALQPPSAAAPAHTQSEIRCLARAIWHEARGEPVEGQIAVAEVIIARSRDRRWRGDLCHTIRMPHQFSFVKGGRTLPIDDPKGAQRMMDLARKVAAGTVASPAKGALFYHAVSVRPSWRLALQRTTRINTHIFYADPAI